MDFLTCSLTTGSLSLAESSRARVTSDGERRRGGGVREHRIDGGGVREHRIDVEEE
jgi:hypothetical protein